MLSSDLSRSASVLCNVINNLQINRTLPVSKCLNEIHYLEDSCMVKLAHKSVLTWLKINNPFLSHTVWGSFGSLCTDSCFLYSQEQSYCYYKLVVTPKPAFFYSLIIFLLWILTAKMWCTFSDLSWDLLRGDIWDYRHENQKQKSLFTIIDVWKSSGYTKDIAFVIFLFYHFSQHTSPAFL